LKLKEIMAYPDLRPEVLQNFRELGNIIIFTKLVDTAMSQHEIGQFIISAPFLGVIPDQTGADASTSPLYTSLQQVAGVLESKSLSTAPSVLREIVNNGWKADKFYRAPNQNISLFRSVLKRIALILEAVKGEWSGSAPDNGVIAVDYTTEFYRLWSGLQFVCCLPEQEGEDSNLETFGDGLLWAGCTIIYFLGQQRRFDVFDFSYHILNVEESAPAPCSTPAIHQFFKRVAQVRDLNQSVFNLLRSYFTLPNEEILIFHPPKTDNVTTENRFISPSTDPSANASTRTQTFYGNTAPIQQGPLTTSGYDEPPPPPPPTDVEEPTEYAYDQSSHEFAPPPPPPPDG